MLLSLLVWICVLTTGLAAIGPNDPVILSVSTSLTSVVPPLGSRQGGTILYIRGTNFNTDASLNVVRVGPYPCSLAADGAKDNMLVCTTTPATNPSQLYTLAITLIVSGNDPLVCSTANCAFSYTYDKTPSISEVVPSSTKGDEVISIWGEHRVTDVGDGRSNGVGDYRTLMVGGSTCSVLDIIQEDTTPNNRDDVKCKIFRNTEAGEYSFTEVTTVGTANKTPRTARYSLFNNQPYEVRVVPQITTLSTQKSGSQGAIVQATGLGWSPSSQFSCLAAGQPCTVTASNPGQLQIKIPPKDNSNNLFGKLTQSAGDTSVHTSPYVSGYGFIYTKYDHDAWRSLDSWLTLLRNPANSLTKLETKIVTELRSDQKEAGGYVEYVKGYFKASVAGEYRFSGVADDFLLVTLSSIASNANVASMNVILRQSVYNYHSFLSCRDNQTDTSAAITLAAGLYFMEVVSVNTGGVGSYRVNVEVPVVTSGTAALPSWQIDRVSISQNSFTAEIITVTVYAASGSFDLFYLVSENGLFVRKTATINIGASPSDFRYALYALAYLSNYNPQITLKTLDASGVVTTTTAEIRGYRYTITLNSYRTTTSTSNLPTIVTTKLVAWSDKTVSGAVAKISTHSAPISGTYRLSIGGQPLGIWSGTAFDLFDIPFNTAQWQISSALKKFFDSDQIQVVWISDFSPVDKIDFIIQYIGLQRDPGIINIDKNGLVGGLGGFTETISTKRAYSATKNFFSPIPYDMLQVPFETPSIFITVNGIPAIISNPAFTYVTAETPALTASSLSGATLSFTLTDPGMLSFTVSDITVSLLGANCVSLSGTIGSLTCSFAQDSNSVLKIPAGSAKPIVHVKQIGFASLDSSIAAINSALTVTSLSPSSSASSGGVVATLLGAGFGLSLADSSSVQITVCNVLVPKLTSMNFNQITFQIPAGAVNGGCSSQIIVNSVQQALTFSYDDSSSPTLGSLSQTQASPIMKTSITITGTNFGSAANTKAFLYQSDVLKYELTITSITATQIVAIFGGGKSGQYCVRVKLDTVGLSGVGAGCSFYYRLTVTQVSPTSFPSGGGLPLIITGTNFGTTIASINVFIGGAANNYCKVYQVTNTQVSCLMPRMDSTYTSGSPLDVVVTARLVEESVCTGTCSITYDTSIAPTIVLPAATEFSGGDVVSLTGTGLGGSIVKINDIVISLITSTATSLSFRYPVLQVGSYEVFINTTSGLAMPALVTTTRLWLPNSMSSTSGGLSGHVLSVIGNGFTTDPREKNLNVWLLCPNEQTRLEVISVTPQELTFRRDAYASASCSVNVTMTKGVFKNYAYSIVSSISLTASVASNNDGTYSLSAASDTINQLWFVLLDPSGTPTSTRLLMTLTTVSATSFTATYTNLPAGVYQIYAHNTVKGVFTVTPNTITNAFTTAPTATAAQVSYAGGNEITISGANFNTFNPKDNFIYVCDLRANIISATTSALTISVPTLLTTDTDTAYGLSRSGLIVGIPIADTSSKASLAFDSYSNTVYSSTAATCFIGFDFGMGSQARIDSIRFMPNPTWAQVSTYLNGAVFEGSNDNSVWTTIATVDAQQVHSGWNFWKSTTAPKYRYVRFQHTTISKCELAELQFYGVIFSTVSYVAGSNTNCDITIKNTPASPVVLSSTVVYSDTKTAVANSINPKFGPSVGGTTITITGGPFAAPLTLTIDNVACTFVSNTQTTAVFTTGVRQSPPASGNSIKMTSDGNVVFLKTTPYLYMDRWTSQDTWGGEAIPRQGDSVYVPKGMTLLVDDSTPLLKAVIVEGKIVFSDEKDMTMDMEVMLINKGEFQAGTESSPYQYKLTITLRNGGYYAKQLPMFGNKGIGCLNCKFDLHGKVRQPTWTEVTATITPGIATFRVKDPVDWVAGQVIVVAATGFDHYENEQRTIASVSVDKMQITVTEPFKFKHFAATERFGTTDFVMQAEVGLLTRNVKIQGDQESEVAKYGSHLMMTGSQKDGLIGRLSYAQFTRCGQPRIVGRYCTHFHMAGEVTNSFVRGLAVHHSYARVLTIHGTHFLLVEKNVGYHVEGHNIFLEDGIETNNVIQDNLMMGTISSLTMLQSDTSVASYWITNPFNIVRRNHAAGGDFYGFWYQIMEHPTGPSATSDICPMGMRIGESKDNVAHTNRRFGLRIFKLSASQYPCIPPHDQTLQDPYSANPAILSVFENYTLWRNEECGFLGEELGYTNIVNFKTIDSRKGGLQFHKTNFTKQPVTAMNCLVVGYSAGNSPTDRDVQYSNARGVIAARTDGLIFSGISFYNFGPTMTPLQSCSQCFTPKLWVTGGKTTTFRQISYSNIQGGYIFWQKWRRQIFVDEDGTLLAPLVSAIAPAISAQSSGTLTPYRPSLLIPNHCYSIVGTTWDDSIYCDQTITLRSILFTNPWPLFDFQSIDIRAKLLATPLDNFATLSPAANTFSMESMIVIKKSFDIKFSWAMPFAVDNYYNMHWKEGIDFIHMAVAPSRLWKATEGVVLRFNYTDARELFEIGKFYSKKLEKPFLIDKATMINPSTCLNGDFFHDKDNKYLFVCVSGRSKKTFEWIDLNGVRCMNFCPIGPPEAMKESFSRLWSNATQWPNGVVPPANSNVTIPFEWNLILDVDPPVLNYVEINGWLIFDRRRDNVFQAHYIWVKQGKIMIGTQESPFTPAATIILHGVKQDNYLVLDSEASGNKMLAVSGGLQFFGVKPETSWSQLTTTATVGSTQLTVASAAGWKVGDKLVIGPSYSATRDDEMVTITAINQNTITFTPALTKEHYGSATPTISNSFGTLDTRSAVGVLSRNIKITRNSDAWGCRVHIFGFLDIPVDPTKQPKVYNGYAVLSGVEFDGCGQMDSENAALRLDRIGQAEPVSFNTKIEGSSIHHCYGLCLYIDKSINVSFTGNVFYWARKFLALVHKVDNYAFVSNLLIGARARDEITNLVETGMVDDIACYEQYVNIDPSTAVIDVSGNLAQGSDGSGFVFPFTNCASLAKYPFVDNTAGSCYSGFMYQKYPDQTCLGASKMKAYACYIGLIANPTGRHQQLIYQGGMFADNHRGITLRFAHQIDDNSCIVRDSYFAGVSRPNCPTCYGDTAIYHCKEGYAVRMLAVTISGEQFPLVKKISSHDVICTQQAFDFKSFMINVVFENYFYYQTSLPYCSKMAVFKRHDIASDGTGSNYMENTRCLNCDSRAWASFQKPNVKWRGWFGGCGELDCTGPNNYFIMDKDGSFFGRPGQLLANNSVVAKGEGCQAIPQVNGHFCDTQSLAVLVYESIAPDFNKRMVWPITLKYDGGSWTSVTNGWREWGWDGPEPLNTRLGRFWSVVKLGMSYNMTYASSPPKDSRYQIQKRILPDGNPHDWVIVRIYFPLPNSIEVLVKNSTGSDIIVKPFPIKKSIGQDLRNYKDVCGANNFHFENGTIEFVVNGKANCQVRVRLTSFIKLSMRLDIPIDDFYSNNGITTFLTNICAFLGIDTGRLKIVGVKQGSTIINATITVGNSPTLDNSKTGSGSQSDQTAEANGLMNKLSSGLSGSSLNVGAPILSYILEKVIINDKGEVVEQPKQTSNITKLAIGLGVGFGVILVGTVVGIIYHLRKRQKISEALESNELNMTTEDDSKVKNTLPDETKRPVKFNEVQVTQYD